ncbi:MAG: uroporphyrinogen-III synthase, partial [Chloroflexi bacterium]|nr:uroporphyrinogen-III synthase [Chloroflexota bacterium]
PALFVVGEVAGLQPFLAPSRLSPLAGKRVLVTRTRSQASSLVTALRLHGAYPIILPAIEIETRVDEEALRDAISLLDASDYRWVVFTSSNAVEVFLDAVMQQRDLRAFGDTRICAIGAATERSLVARGLRPDLVPDDAVGNAITPALLDHGPLEGTRVLLPRAQRAGSVLPDSLRQAGATVDDVPLYLAAPPAQPSSEALDVLRAGQIDIVTFTSSSTVRNLITLLGGDTSPLRAATVACIGPTTAETARAAGLTPDVVADVHTIDGLIDALRTYVHSGQEAS